MLSIIGALIGFTNIGDVNAHLEAFEKSVSEGTLGTLADHMLVFMVQELFSNLEFLYAQFPCTDLSGEQLYVPFWEAVGCLERCGFRVMALICDGLAANGRLYDPSARPGEVYCVPNPYSGDDRQVYFISDPPHLIKTVRNAWCNSKRKLWVSLYHYHSKSSNKGHSERE